MSQRNDHEASLAPPDISHVSTGTSDRPFSTASIAYRLSPRKIKSRAKSASQPGAKSTFDLMVAPESAPAYNCAATAAPRIRLILATLQDASMPRSMNLPSLSLHRLKGPLARLWSVRVSGNWRIVFRFEDGEAVDVNLIDYH